MKSKRFEIIAEDVQVLSTIPSGSGIVVVENSVFIIGDDATALFKLSLQTNEFRVIPLLNNDSAVFRINKPDKHDLECLTLATIEGKECILAFSSGSFSPQRDSLLIVDINEPVIQKWVSLKQLYDNLRQRSATKEINLEGAVLAGNKIYLFDRISNQLYVIDIKEFSDYIKTGNVALISKITIHQFDLPSSNGIRSSLSGGCLLDNGLILFTSSVEDVPNAYNDGEIGGSYIGIIALQGEPVVQQIALLKDKQGNILNDKLESIDIIGKYDNGDIKALAIADNDDGQSKLFKIRIVIR